MPPRWGPRPLRLGPWGHRALAHRQASDCLLGVDRAHGRLGTAALFILRVPLNGKAKKNQIPSLVIYMLFPSRKKRTFDSKRGRRVMMSVLGERKHRPVGWFI